MTVQRLLSDKGAFVPMIRSEVTLQQVIEQLKIDHAGALVVTDDNRTILGIISERDIVRGLQSHGRNVVDKPVGELMTRKVVTCDVGQPLTTVLELMDRHQIHHVPIVKDGVLCGIINMLDVVKYRLAEIDAEAKALKEYVAGRA